MILLLFLLSFSTVSVASAQSLLQKKVTFNLKNVPVYEVLKEVERQGGFLFSYNSNLLDADRMINIEVKNEPVYAVLNSVLGRNFKYVRNGRYLIISEPDLQGSAKVWGRITDMLTGNPIPYATVYNRHRLIATMSDADGYFELLLKKRDMSDSISVSRISYGDTTVLLSDDLAQPLQIRLTAMDVTLDSVFVSMMQRDWLSRRLVSSKNVINSINLNHFLVRQPVQFSIIPGWSTRGKMSAQVVNNFSFNVIGGFNGGGNGLEMGGIYNMTNGDVKYLQSAGIFNIVGGEAVGLQIAGGYNKASRSTGLQVAGLFNRTESSAGMQVAGIYNHSFKMKGFQQAGIYNRTNRMKGVQIAGLINNSDSMQGFQMAGFVNKNKYFRGFQIGVVNISDTSDGYSLGLVNISKNGLHKVSFSVNEMEMPMLSFKSGNRRLYSIVTGGVRVDRRAKAYAFGFGAGSDLVLAKSLSFNPEVTSLYIYYGNWNKQNLAWRTAAHLKLKLAKSIEIFSGPAFTILYSKPGVDIPNGYKKDIHNGHKLYRISNQVHGWLGWHAGVNIF